MKAFEDKNIWITGASSGIGKALAIELSKAGANLLLSSRKKSELEAVRNRCQHPEKTTVLSFDLEEFRNMDTIVETAIAAFGPIDMLINNAGISQRSLIYETNLDVYERLMVINYLGTIALTKSLLPHFIARNSGHFVTVTSLMGKFGSPYRSGYCGAKHALHGFMDVLRMEHQKENIAVTLICPGFVRTAVAQNALTASGKTQGTDDKATAKGMSPDKFARKMLRAVKRRKHEAYIGGREVAGVYLKRLFPKLLHKIVLRSRVV